MIYKNVFSIDNTMLLEYAYKLYQVYQKLYFYCRNKKLKEKLIKLGIPETIIFTKLNKEDKVINEFCNYNQFKSEQFYRISYGYGNEDYRHNFLNKYLKKKIYLSPSDYENQFIKCEHKTIGIAKYDTHYELPSDIIIPTDKPIILFFHTWNKHKKMPKAFPNIEGFSDVEHTMSVLEKYTDKFTIIHKNHHNTSFKSDKFINIDSGTYDSRKLIDIADIIIADYGGSAVEAIISEKAKILYVNAENHNLINSQNFDVIFHNIFNHTSNEDFEKNFLKLIDEPLSENELKLRKEWRDKLFPYLDCGAQRLGEFIKNLDNEEW